MLSTVTNCNGPVKFCRVYYQFVIIRSVVEVTAHCVWVGGAVDRCVIIWRDGRTNGRTFTAMPPSESSSSPNWKLHGSSPSLMTLTTHRHNRHILIFDVSAGRLSRNSQWIGFTLHLSSLLESLFPAFQQLSHRSQTSGLKAACMLYRHKDITLISKNLPISSVFCYFTSWYRV